MLGFDKVTYLFLFFKFILSERLSNSFARMRCFTILRIHKCGIHSVL